MKNKIVIGIAVAAVAIVAGFAISNPSLLRGALVERPGAFQKPPTISVVRAYPVSTNPMLYQWDECEVNRERSSAQGMSDEDLDKYFVDCVNYLPMRFCNAKVIDRTNLTSEPDTDGDGVSNVREFQMGLNPCEAYSTGGTVSDGDFDYDGDGIINRLDTFTNGSGPICNPTGLYVSDCV